MRSFLFCLIFLSLFFSFSCDISKKIQISGKSDDDYSQTDFDDIENEQTDNDTGNSGDSGNSGNSGDTGNTGNTGNSGNTGDTGNSGNSGNSGDTGDSGNSGNSGDTGNSGNSGTDDDCIKDSDCSNLDGNCVKGVCNEGKCETENKPENTECNDGEFCNGKDICNNSGNCISGTDYPCGDTLCREDSGGMCCEGGFAGTNCSKCVRFVYNSGIKTPDGLTWNTAFANIQEAVNSANDAILIESNGIESCEIWVAQGTYDIPATIKIYSNISIIGGLTAKGEERVDDATLTILNGAVNKMDNIIDASDASNVNLKFLTLSGNKNEGSGNNYAGGLYISNAADFTIDSVRFISNEANGESTNGRGYEGRGGAIAIIDSNVTILDSFFTGNKAKNGEDTRYTGKSTAAATGGAIFISNSTVSIYGSTFSENSVSKVEDGTASGGAIFASNPTLLTISGCKFEKNTSQNWGGAVRVEKGNIVSEFNNFLENSASENGGAIEFNNIATAKFNKTVFFNNTAVMGGAFHLSNNSQNIEIKKCDFHQNSATSLGAGISIVTSKNNITIEQTTFYLNNCKGGNECRGGAILVDDNSTATIINSKIIKNNAKSYGGGIYTRKDSVVNLVFSTLADNTTGTSNNSGSGVHNYDDSTINVYSSIIHGNSPGTQIQNNSGGASNVAFSLIQGGHSGTGNINADPLFLDRDSIVYHLKSDSPCIDSAGTANENPSIDMDEKIRPYGDGYDMGCYEFHN